MGKSNSKKADSNVKRKKPANVAVASKRKQSSQVMMKNPGRIKNRLKRAEMYGKYLLEKKSQKRAVRLKRVKEVEALGEISTSFCPTGGKVGAICNQTRSATRTIDNTREMEITAVQPTDDEVIADESQDEFASYFADIKRPKLMITTRPRPSRQLFYFIRDLITLFPNSYFYPRRSYSVKEICRHAAKENFTHLLCLSEKSKECDGLMISHLPSGPSVFFKVSNVLTTAYVPNHGKSTIHVPELVLNNFGTRLGHRVGRFLGSLFPHNVQFQGRQVVTFHNQRDYIFVRHHRYDFEDAKAEAKSGKAKTIATSGEDGKINQKAYAAARVQDLGPRFTLKMQWLQVGTFDAQLGEYEWFHKRKEMDTTRRKFHL